MSYEPISCYGNYFVGIDGEGFEDADSTRNGYGLLDSSMDDYARLYTGTRLTTEECLGWLWGLAQHSGYCVFSMFGARYDFDNWMRTALDFEQIKRYAQGQPIRVGNWLIIHQDRFKFELRKIRDEDTSKAEYATDRYAYSRIQAKMGGKVYRDMQGVQFWDVAPFWQTSFIKALDMTLDKDKVIERELIEEGKEARGTFTHENIEWVSRYNKAECHNLAWMCVELDKWFKAAGVKPLHYNGPGSAAKAMLRTYQPYLHAGRRVDKR